MFESFEQVVKACKSSAGKRRIAVAAAADGPVIDAVIRVKRDGIADAVLVGSKTAIGELLRERDAHPGDFEIVNAPEGTEGQAAAEVIRRGEANVLMKGLLETKALLGPVVKKENGLRTGHVMSHCAFFQLSDYSKLILNTDGGMIPYPSLEDKKHIIENAVLALRALGYDCPKVACLCASETVSPKITETVDADCLCRMNAEGALSGCAVAGPISYDIAMSPQIAAHKGYSCPYCGDFDIFLVPNLVSGNLMGKCYIMNMHALMAGIVMGAKVPIVLTSRGASAEEKYNSIALASLIGKGLSA